MFRNYSEKNTLSITLPFIDMDKKSVIIISVVWALLQAYFYIYLRIFVNFETSKYIDEALYVDTFHKFSNSHYYLYSLYVIIHWIFLKLSFEFYGVYLFQLVCNYIATILMFKILLHIVSHQKVALAGCIIWLFCFHYQRFTAYLYTESLYGSCIVFQMYWMLLKQDSLKKFAILSLLSLAVVMMRPTGIVFIAIWVVYAGILLIRKRKTIAAFSLILCVLIIVSYFLYLIINQKDNGFNFIIPFTHNYVQCYIPNKTLKSYTLNISTEGNAVSILLYYLYHNPVHFLHAALLKSQEYFCLTRSYYSGLHNAFIRLFYYPLYLSALFGLWTNRKNIPLWMIYSLLVIGFFTFSEIMTCEDWSSRFLLPIIPFIILLATKGIEMIYLKYQKRV